MIKKSQNLKWIISAALFLVLLTACGNATTSGSVQGTGNSSTTAHSKHAVNNGSRGHGTTAASVGVALAPTPTPQPTAAEKKALPQATQPPVIPTTPPVQPALPHVQSAGSNNIPAAAQAVFNLINQERAGAGLPALTWSTQLVQSAHQHNLAMAAANQLSHQLPGEAYLGDREKQAGVNWIAAAENIGVSDGNAATSAAVSLNQSMFAEQPPDDGHRLNILSTSCTMVGVDVVVDSVHNRVWLTEDFAAV